MSKNNLYKILHKVKNTVNKYSPEILTGVGIFGMATTVVLAVKATPKAMELIEEEKKKRISEATVEEAREWSEQGGVPMSKSDIVKVAWKPYIGVAISGVAATSCFLLANSVHASRNAALMTMYQLSTTALSEYREKTAEVVGKEKEQEIHEKVVQEKVYQMNFVEDDIIHTGEGNILFYDPISKIKFKSSENAIEKHVNSLNYRMCYGNEPYISLNEFYDACHLPRYEFNGDSIGWSTSKNLIEVTCIPGRTNTGEPCFILEFTQDPTYGYDDLHL